jgi:hypothetical protein
MFPMNEAWSPALGERTTQATELALAGLRERRAVLPPDLLDLLLDEKFRDPMLGVLGAHSLLLAAEIDRPRLELLLGNLQAMLPLAPDVIALKALCEEAGVRTDEAPGSHGQLCWPPMLLVGYTALIRLDARAEGSLIASGSSAQTAASRLAGEGIWTSWSVEEPRPPQRRKRRSRRRDPVARALRDMDATKPVTQRVVDYLATVADVEAPSSLNAMLQGDLGRAASVSAATSVPLRTVETALGEIKDNLD